jgi:hypothetical protein
MPRSAESPVFVLTTPSLTASAVTGTPKWVDADKTALGCMSGGSDPECHGLFGQLGLAIADKAAGPQQVFRVKPAATLAR